MLRQRLALIAAMADPPPGGLQRCACQAPSISAVGCAGRFSCVPLLFAPDKPSAVSFFLPSFLNACLRAEFFLSFSGQMQLRMLEAAKQLHGAMHGAMLCVTKKAESKRRTKAPKE